MRVQLWEDHKGELLFTKNWDEIEKGQAGRSLVIREPFCFRGAI